jgi:hypothetical protein
MKKFKVICQMWHSEDYTIFVKADDEAEAYSDAKRYMLLDRPELDFHQVKSATEI